MSAFTTEQKQRILSWHKARIKRKAIKHMFKITDRQLDNMLQRERLKQERKKTND
ncbi:MAG: hypothetical protein HY841_00020 [Bacteroidetes bacterium]|nr:hypothetical protein [Bacteroidota bacterium]